jgi:hypothetical protein
MDVKVAALALMLVAVAAHLPTGRATQIDAEGRRADGKGSSPLEVVHALDSVKDCENLASSLACKECCNKFSAVPAWRKSRGSGLCACLTSESQAYDDTPNGDSEQ